MAFLFLVDDVLMDDAETTGVMLEWVRLLFSHTWGGQGDKSGKRANRLSLARSLASRFCCYLGWHQQRGYAGS